MDFIIPKTRQLTIRKEGQRVVIISDGQLVADLPWDAAIELAKGITTQARRIEEEIKADDIIADQALLIRLGFPLGLTNNPGIKSEAHKEAQHNTFLRKAITGARAIGIPSDSIVGTPGLIQHKPKEVNHGR